nr:MAG TPA: hypothetical protein [Caudoviricetes sp.]
MQLYCIGFNADFKFLICGILSRFQSYLFYLMYALTPVE